MRCKSGCTDCCGPVLVSRWEAEQIGDGGGALNPEKTMRRMQAGILTCPYASPEGCKIYDLRPFLCRIFGTVDKDPYLTCPHGCKPESPLTQTQGNELRMAYQRLVDKK